MHACVHSEHRALRDHEHMTRYNGLEIDKRCRQSGLEKNMLCWNLKRERERGGEREKDREREREREREKEKEREKERKPNRKRERERERGGNREKAREREREMERQRWIHFHDALLIL